MALQTQLDLVDIDAVIQQFSPPPVPMDPPPGMEPGFSTHVETPPENGRCYEVGELVRIVGGCFAMSRFYRVRNGIYEPWVAVCFDGACSMGMPRNRRAEAFTGSDKPLAGPVLAVPARMIR